MDQALLLSVLLSQWWFSVSQYHLVVEPMSWSDAQTHCRQHYSYLATVTDMKDVEELKEAANGHTDAWIGLHRTSESDLDRTWHWSQPTVQYKEEESQWGPLYSQSGSCATIDENNLWRVVECYQSSCFFCYDVKKPKKTLVKMKMSSPVDLNPFSPIILQQLQEHLKVNHLGDVKLTWTEDDNHCVFKKEKSSSQN
uniref:C-type lectin domain-containing protein n=1 Tax=Knipowitschia caucasica TaxID=637954 RepID=A0AAV2JGQ6_KNICA